MAQMAVDDLVVDLRGREDGDLLADWRWLLGDGMRPLLVSALGDVFVADGAGHVHRLETGWARLARIAGSVEEFHDLAREPARIEQWFGAGLVAALRARGLGLGAGECYGFDVPPAIGGDPDPRNLRPTDVALHLAILGQVHEQTRGLPEGTPVTAFTTKP